MVNNVQWDPQAEMLETKTPKSETGIYLGISLTVILFNLIAVWGVDILLHDDPVWYGNVIAGKFPQILVKSSPLLAYKEWIAWQIMAYSPQLARLLYILFLMVPLSCGFYYLLRRQLGFSRWEALAAAILPNILPHQSQIPAGINMSYPLLGMVFIFLALITGLHYLETKKPRKWPLLLTAAVSYYLACHFMEQSLFLYPALVLIFFAYRKRNRKPYWIFSLFTVIAADKLIRMMISPRKVPVSVPLEEILERTGLYFKWTLPFPGIHPLFPVIFTLAVIAAGFILHLKYAANTGERISRIDGPFTKTVSPVEEPGRGVKKQIVNLYAFFIVWVTASMVVFLGKVPFFIPRYTYIAAYGQVALLVYSISVLLRAVLPGKYKTHAIVLMGVIVFSGIYRYINLSAIYAPGNTSHAIIVKELNKIELPPKSQVVVVGAEGIPGCWLRTCGYLRFALKRKDIDGIVGPINTLGYYNFDRHFDPKDRKMLIRHLMTGLSLDRPVFLFLLEEKSRRLRQLEYTLEWKGETWNSPWTIIHVDKKTGKPSPWVSGVGKEQYETALKELEKKGISQAEIVWGGPPTQEELARLEGSL